MHVDRDQESGARRFAMRHGLAHVLDGHVAEIAFAHDGHDWRGYEETVADAFALLDVVPDHQLDELRTAGWTPAEIERWTYATIATWTSGWSAERIRDRVQLRLAVRESA